MPARMHIPECKNVLITGSSRGIGKGLAEAFLAEGCNVIINGRDPEQVDRTVSYLSAQAKEGRICVPCIGDVTSPTDAQRIIDTVLLQFGRLDVLVCNVGSGGSVSPGTETYQEWQRMFAINLFSTTNMVEAVRGRMSGAIVCISSICGVNSIPGAPVTYSAAKAALNAYVKGIARPLAREGTRINAIALGNMLFEGSVWDRRSREDEAALKRMLDREVSLGMLGEPADAASLAVFLASDSARFATGAVWTLDGGQVR